jgi:large subunit ribosomal protein L30e
VNEMAKKESNVFDVIKKEIEQGKAILGLERTMKELKKSNLIKVYVASNTGQDLKDDLEYYSSIEKIEIVNLDIPNDELGITCKKPFSISVVGILK